MQIRSLSIFVSLAENNCDFSIHRDLGIPRSTLWAYIDEIESATGLKLINRKKQNNSLTDEAKVFLTFAKRVVRMFEEGVSYVKSLSEGPAPFGEILIATTSAVGSSWLMPSLKDFYIKFPHIRLRVLAEDAIAPSTERLADIILRPIDEKKFLKKHWSLAYTFGLFASPGYLKKAGTPSTAQDLLNHAILAYGENSFSYVPDIDWHVRGRWGNLPKLTPYITINSTTSLYQAAVADLGICSAFIHAHKFYGGKLVRILPEFEGPTVRTYFCTKMDMSFQKRTNVKIFSHYFSTYLKNMGVQIQEEASSEDAQE